MARRGLPLLALAWGAAATPEQHDCGVALEELELTEDAMLLARVRVSPDGDLVLPEQDIEGEGGALLQAPDAPLEAEGSAAEPNAAPDAEPSTSTRAPPHATEPERVGRDFQSMHLVAPSVSLAGASSSAAPARLRERAAELQARAKGLDERERALEAAERALAQRARLLQAEEALGPELQFGDSAEDFVAISDGGKSETPGKETLTTATTTLSSQLDYWQKLQAKDERMSKKLSKELKKVDESMVGEHKESNVGHSKSNENRNQSNVTQNKTLSDKLNKTLKDSHPLAQGMVPSDILWFAVVVLLLSWYSYSLCGPDSPRRERSRPRAASPASPRGRRAPAAERTRPRDASPHGAASSSRLEERTRDASPATPRGARAGLRAPAHGDDRDHCEPDSTSTPRAREAHAARPRPEASKAHPGAAAEPTALWPQSPPAAARGTSPASAMQAPRALSPCVVTTVHTVAPGGSHSTQATQSPGARVRMASPAARNLASPVTSPVAAYRAVSPGRAGATVTTPIAAYRAVSPGRAGAATVRQKSDGDAPGRSRLGGAGAS